MIDLSTVDYSMLDTAVITRKLFFPRKEYNDAVIGDRALVVDIPIDEGVEIGARIYVVDKSSPTILFFHGNGEIVADYDFFGLALGGIGINFLPVDYRGYGRSTGVSTVTHMMRDAHVIFEYVMKYMEDNGFTGPLLLMGRSLGSASAVELARHYPQNIGGLIIESGIAYSLPLLRIAGINTFRYGLSESHGFRNIEKIGDYFGPTLIIHAELDNVIPFSDGLVLYEACPSENKIFLEIRAAGHNTIHQQCMDDYMATIRRFADMINVTQDS